MGKIINIDENGIYHVVYTQEMSSEDLAAFVKETQDVIDSNPKDILALIDITAYSQRSTYEERKQVREINQKIKPYVKKEAVIVNDVLKRMIAQAIYSITGRNENTSFFQTKEEALKWLKE